MKNDRKEKLEFIEHKAKVDAENRNFDQPHNKGCLREFVEGYTEKEKEDRQLYRSVYKANR